MAGVRAGRSGSSGEEDGRRVPPQRLETGSRYGNRRFAGGILSRGSERIKAGGDGDDCWSHRLLLRSDVYGFLFSVSRASSVPGIDFRRLRADVPIADVLGKVSLPRCLDRVAVR